MSTIFIEKAKRTATGAFQGALKSFSATQLGSYVIQAVKPDQDVVDGVVMGCVLPAGLGQAPARQAALGAELPYSVNCSTINKVCGSGLMAVMVGWSQILTNQAHRIIAGGMESMTNAPYLLDQARSGYRFGHNRIIDHMLLDGLEDAYHRNGHERFPMGHFAEETAIRYGVTREQQDQFAISSFQKAQTALEKGFFTEEIVPITVKDRAGDIIIDKDEPPMKGKIDKIPSLKPAFRANGTVTAASSSSLADGAAAILLTSESKAHQPLAAIKGFATHSQEPEWFTTAPLGAIQKLLDQVGWKISDVDLFEINEAFAVVPMVAIDQLRIDPTKVNINGGACALGHPLGASGARVLVTLLHNLKHHGLKRGIASLCIGGGEGIAVAVEMV